MTRTYDVITNVNVYAAAQSLTDKVAAVMRKNKVMIANGSWDEYNRAIAIVDVEFGTKNATSTHAVVMSWCNVH
jgi:hypothetical protein